MCEQYFLLTFTTRILCLPWERSTLEPSDTHVYADLMASVVSGMDESGMESVPRKTGTLDVGGSTEILWGRQPRERMLTSYTVPVEPPVATTTPVFYGTPGTRRRTPWSQNLDHWQSDTPGETGNRTSLPHPSPRHLGKCYGSCDLRSDVQPVV